MVRFKWMTYYPFPDFDEHTPRPPKVFKTRDGSAFCELMAPLLAQGHVYGGQILNYPWLGGTKGCCPPVHPGREATAVDDHLDGCDLLVLTIRPPFEDATKEWKPTRPPMIPCSYSQLEGEVFARMRTFFHGCERTTLSIANQWLQNGEVRHYSFRVQGVSHSWFSNCHDVHATLGLLVYHPKENGFPAVLNAFGMGGNETLVLCSFLANREPNYLCTALESTEPFMAVFHMTLDMDRAPGVTTTQKLLEGWDIRPVFTRRWSSSGTKNL